MAAISAHALIFRPSSSIYRPCLTSSSSSSHCLPSSSNTSGRLSFSTHQTKRSSVIAMGSSSSSLSGFDDRIGEILADVSIFTASTGESIMFKDLWDQKEGMAVVALLRHFGCPCCWELASTLKESKERFDSAGVKLVAVGVGTPDKARILAERAVKELVLDLENIGSISEDHELPFPLDSLYADPDRKAYDVLGLYYGLGRTFFNPASAKVFTRFGSLQKAVKNYTISATPDDRSSVLQQGGMFVFKGNKLLYARKDEGTGDHAPLSEILDLCCTASAV